MMQLTPEKKISIAKSQLLISNPFFATLIFQLEFVPQKGLAGTVVDGTNLKYDPEFIAQLTPKETEAWMAENVATCLLLHHIRRNGRDKEAWEDASDQAVRNWLAENSSFTFNSNATIDTQFKGKTAEEIYPYMKKKKQGGGGKGGKGPSGSNFSQIGDDQPQQGDGNEGGENQSQSDSQQEQEEKWKAAAIEALNAAKTAGKIPGDMERFVGRMNQPKIDWVTALKRFIENIIPSDYQWTPPNKRYVSQDLYFPGIKKENVGEIVVVIDTSGSITEAQLVQFAGEITSICDDVRPSKVHIIYCDTKVQKVQEVMYGDPVQLGMHGGGGTDFVPPFAYVTKNNINPLCLVYLTDLECDSYPKEPDYPVLWVTDSHNKVGKFGETVRFQHEGR